MQDHAHTGTSKGLSHATNRGPIRKFLPQYANVYITIQSHGLSAGVRTHYVTADKVRNELLQLQWAMVMHGQRSNQFPIRSDL